MKVNKDFAIAECAIRQLHAHYVDAVWRSDFVALADCFSEDCEWRIAGMVLRGREEIIEHSRLLFAPFRRLLITLRTPVLEIGDGVASGRTYFSGQNVLADGRAYAPIGRYFERFADEGDRWRFTWRLFQTLYSGPPDMSGDFPENPEFGPPPGMPPRDAMPDNHAGVSTKDNRGPMGSSGA